VIAITSNGEGWSASQAQMCADYLRTGPCGPFGLVVGSSESCFAEVRRREVDLVKKIQTKRAAAIAQRFLICSSMIQPRHAVSKNRIGVFRELVRSGVAGGCGSLEREGAGRVGSRVVLRALATRGSSLGADRLETVSLLLIEDGFVLVSASDRGSARRIVVSLAGPGCVLLPPSAQERLEALSDARLTLVSANSNRLVLEIPAAALAIAEGLRGGLRDCRESLAQFASHRHADRVQRKLIQLAHTCGKVGNEGLLVDLPLTHELLAEMVGSTRETVTRALTQLAQEGILQHERGRYRIAVSPESIETE